MPNPHAFYGGEAVTIPTGCELTIHYPASTTSGMQDAYITEVNFHAVINAAIAAAVADIASIQGDIIAINTINQKIGSGVQGASFTFTQTADSDIYLFYAFWASGNPTISIGTTLGGTEIMGSTVLNITGIPAIHAKNNYSASSRTIYVTISGGTLRLHRFERRLIDPH